MKNKAVFLDRDGVINEVIYHKEMGIIDSPFTVEQFKLLPKVAEAINIFHDLGFRVIIVSNQPGMAKYHFSIDVFEKIREKMNTELKKDDAEVDAEYYCFHHPYATVKKYKKICNCRKPKPGMLQKAAEEHNIDLSKSWMIGDGIIDIAAGQTAGCKTILIGRMKCDLCKIMEDENVKPDYIKPNLYKASLIIKNKERG
jgi:D-glycero-D-manno-heptose 1,7-bisphosphate phosphatase